MAKKATKKKRGAAEAVPLSNDMFDEVAKFHNDNALQFDHDIDESEEDADSDLDDDAMDESSDSDADLDAGGQLGKIIAAERAIKRQIALQKVDGEDEVSSEEERQWGSKKRDYYDAEDIDVDFDSDQEAALEEEEEALRLQKQQAQKLTGNEFGIPDADDSDSDGDEDEGAPESGALGRAAQGVSGVHSEAVTRHLSGADEERLQAAVLADAPELLTLLPDLSSSLAEVRKRTGPLLHELHSSPDLVTRDGMSYLDAKHMLLLMYSIHILFYILLKLEGQPVRDHPVMQRLVAAKTYLEKLKGVDKRLKHQVEKLLRAAKAAAAAGSAGGSGDAGDAEMVSYRANPDALVSKVDEDMDGSGAYRPPKLTAVTMEEEGGVRGGREARQAERSERAELRRARQSSFVRDLEAEVMGAPEEETAVGAVGGARDTGNLELLKQQQRLEARAAAEEDLMVRVPLSKDERKRLKAARRSGLAGGSVLDDFADDVAGVLQLGEASKGFTDKLRLGQQFGGTLPVDAPGQIGGDSELPLKPALPERRAKYDAVKARQAVQIEALARDAAAQKHDRLEDAFYTEAREAAAAKKKAKGEKRKAPEMHPPLADEHRADARKVTTEIQKNRGLTPHRRKDLKNPRKKGRVKFAKAETRRKGQVQAIKSPAGAYGGESTGIKAKISKSVRFSS